MSASTTPGSSSKPSKHISSKPSKHINVFFLFFFFLFFPWPSQRRSLPITSDHSSIAQTLTQDVNCENADP
jgi:hypothetical protein